MISRSFVLGYHGCEEATAIKLVNGHDAQIFSTKEYDWLGNGIYFWEDSSSRALRWAHEKSFEKPAVLGAIIDLGNCLNLIDAEHLDLVRAAHRTYLDSCKISNFKPAQNKGRDMRARYLDKAVFDTLHQLRKDQGEPPFETIRAFFVEGEPLYDNAGLRALDHVQICVRDPKNIVGYFLPRPRGVD
jgi:hypothetical protein